MIENHLPILQIIIPLVAAPVCIFLRHPVLTWALTTVVSWITFYISLRLLLQVLDSGEIIYELGGWAAPWGIEYVVDTLSAWVLVIVSSIGAIVTPYAKVSVEKEIERDRIYIFYAMLLLCETGLLGITITGDALFLLRSIATNDRFEAAAAVPDGYTGPALDIVLPAPASAGGPLFLRLRDAPDAVGVVMR